MALECRPGDRAHEDATAAAALGPGHPGSAGPHPAAGQADRGPARAGRAGARGHRVRRDGSAAPVPARPGGRPARHDLACRARPRGLHARQPAPGRHRQDRTCRPGPRRRAAWHRKARSSPRSPTRPARGHPIWSSRRERPRRRRQLPVLDRRRCSGWPASPSRLRRRARAMTGECLFSRCPTARAR